MRSQQVSPRRTHLLFYVRFHAGLDGKTCVSLGLPHYSCFWRHFYSISNLWIKVDFQSQHNTR